MANLFVISAPSGAGKTSLIKELLKKLDNIYLSISHTTRNKRITEKNKENYFFISDIEFKELINNNELLEYAEVFGNYYGTSKKVITEQLNNQKDVILEIDWQGHRQVKKHFSSAVSIFILPPSIDELKDRLTKRGEDHITVIEKRMQYAKSEIEHYDEYDFLIINQDFSKALRELESIIISHRLKLLSQVKNNKNPKDKFKEVKILIPFNSNKFVR